MHLVYGDICPTHHGMRTTRGNNNWQAVAWEWVPFFAWNFYASVSLHTVCLMYKINWCINQIKSSMLPTFAFAHRNSIWIWRNSHFLISNRVWGISQVDFAHRNLLFTYLHCLPTPNNHRGNVMNVRGSGVWVFSNASCIWRVVTQYLR